VIRYTRDWIHHRTGLGGVIDALLLEPIPGGAKWRYVWGSALAIVFTIQMVTGVLLMTAYSPGDSTAWSSVYFIQYEMDFGWLIRGLHHFGSQTMVVLLGLHMLQVVIAGAHLKPREVNWWLGLGLMATILGLSLTGYLLPWDQKGYYATQVATSIAGGLPVVGSMIQKVVVGGPAYGNHTLTRFFALHVAILPGAVIALLIAHIWVFRRHGVTAPKNAVGSGWFWPDQAFRDMLVGLVIFGIMLALVIHGWGHKVEPQAGPDGAVAERSLYDKVAHAGRDGRGANLDAPADPNTPYPARPEWYFLALFQLLKYFEGPQMLIGTVVIPAGIGIILFILPWLGSGRMRPFGHLFAIVFVLALFLGVGYLTAQAWVEDQHPNTFQPNAYEVDPKTELLKTDSAGNPIERPNPDPPREPYYHLRKLVAGKRYSPVRATAFQKEMEEADERAARAIHLAADGIPNEGARYLLRNDPMTQGKTLFKSHCGTCHSCGKECKNENPTASDLNRWGSAEWIKGLLTNADDPKYFGHSHLMGGKMSKWVGGQRDKAKTKPDIAENLDKIAEWLAQHPRKDAPSADDKTAFAEGYRRFDNTCAECHTYKGTKLDEMEAPDLAGYGDPQWLREMVMLPSDPTKYGAKNKMPAFRDLLAPGAGIAEPIIRRVEAAHKVINLSELDRELIIRFVTGDGRVVFGGEPIGAAPERK
jgi:ubiquinol-cytochrome c reductase cytochrome b subunit